MSFFAEDATTISIIKDVIAVVGSLAGLLAVYIGLRRYITDTKDRHDNEQKKLAAAELTEIRQWQKTIISKILIRENAPISFEDLKQKYRSEASAAQGVDVPKAELQEFALRRILLELAANNAVWFQENDTYRSPVILPITPHKEQAAAYAQHIAISNAVSEILTKEPGKHNLSELGIMISETLKIQVSQVNQALSNFVAAGTLRVDQDGLVRLAIQGFGAPRVSG